MATKKKTAKKGSTEKGPTKAELYSLLAEKAGLKKTEVSAVFDALDDEIAASLKKTGTITIPGIVKITKKHKPARPSRPGRNPFTGEPIMIKAKPAHLVVKVSALKNLKDKV